MNKGAVDPWPEDGEVVKRVRDGDSQAFGLLVRKHQERLFAAMLIMLGNRQDAEDIAQEALAMSFRKLDSFEHRSSFYTWLHKIAFRLAISHRRKYARRSSLSVGPLDVAAEPTDTRETEAPILLERQEQHDRIQLALAQLDAERRNIIVLRDIQGLDYQEIADLLRVPVGTVRSRLHRARFELKEILMAERFQP